jgi:hypothetical protein
MEQTPASLGIEVTGSDSSSQRCEVWSVESDGRMRVSGGVIVHLPGGVSLGKTYSKYTF